MPSVKISELPEISHLSTNTEATLVVGVDLNTGTTGKINVATLGEGLYAYQPLKVGENQVLFSNTIGQFSGNSNTFLQINNQNFNSNGSSDYVASASDSDNTNKYIDMGINGSTFNDPIYTSMRPYDGYVYVRGPTAASTTGAVPGAGWALRAICGGSEEPEMRRTGRTLGLGDDAGPAPDPAKSAAA
jgi:hypothetical protein